MTENIHEMVSGSYYLEQAVDNPGKDGRRSDWYSAKQIEPGRYFVRVRTEASDIPGVNVTSTSVYINKGTRPHMSGAVGATLHDDTWAGQDVVALMLQHMRRDESLEGALMFAEHDDYTAPGDVLLRLVAAGVVGEDAVRVAIAAQAEADAAAAEREELTEQLARKEAS